MNPTDTQPERDVRAFLDTALARWRAISEAEQRIREEALEDLRFRAGEQWPTDLRAQRDQDKRPCLTINRLPQFVHQVVNDIRQNRPQIACHPVDDTSDPDTAEVMEGLIRHIWTQSDADIALDTAADAAATCGFGYFRVLTDWDGPLSFDKVIRIEPVKNAFAVYMDPHRRWCFITDDLTRADYEEEYPRTEAAGLSQLETIGDRPSGWLQPDTIRVAEYFYQERVERELVQLDDGTICFSSELADGDEARIIQRRKTLVPTIKWCKFNAVEILQEEDWPDSEEIPIIGVYGEELFVDGERQLISLIRYARDPQRMYNYWASAETEAIALAPRAPFIAEWSQIEGFEAQWKAANTRNMAVLPYRVKSAGNNLVPPPQRNAAEPPIMAISHARQASSDDLKASMGMYDPSLGARSNETSGRAIIARQREGDTATFHFADNVNRSVRLLGRILLQLIPRIYDMPRVIRILGADDTRRAVPVNQPTRVKGIEKIYDLTAGKYDIVVTSGPSYSTRRQEAAESITALVQSYPALMQIVGDLLVKNLDWPGAHEIAERLRKMLPAQFRESEDGQPATTPADPRMQQLAAQHDQLVQAVQALTEQIQTKQLELDSRERIAALQARSRLVETLLRTGSAEAIEALRQELAVLDRATARADSADAQAAAATRQGPTAPPQQPGEPDGDENQPQAQPPLPLAA